MLNTLEQWQELKLEDLSNFSSPPICQGRLQLGKWVNSHFGLKFTTPSCLLILFCSTSDGDHSCLKGNEYVILRDDLLFTCVTETCRMWCRQPCRGVLRKLWKFSKRRTKVLDNLIFEKWVESISFHSKEWTVTAIQVNIRYLVWNRVQFHKAATNVRRVDAHFLAMLEKNP